MICFLLLVSDDVFLTKDWYISYLVEYYAKKKKKICVQTTKKSIISQEYSALMCLLNPLVMLISFLNE